MGAIDHPDQGTKITIEVARRLTAYTHESYFRHLRLYDYVLKNTKLSEVKRVHIPKAEPFWGESLDKAMVLGDCTTMDNDTINVESHKNLSQVDKHLTDSQPLSAMINASAIHDSAKKSSAMKTMSEKETFSEAEPILAT